MFLLQSARYLKWEAVKLIDPYNRIYTLLVQLFNYIELFIKLLQNAQRFVIERPNRVPLSRLKRKEVTSFVNAGLHQAFHKN